MQALDVKYAKIWSIGFIVFGLLMLGLNWMVYNSGGQPPVGGFAVGAIVPVIGVLSLINPFYRWKDGILQARNLLGMTLFRHPLERVTIEPGKQPGDKQLIITKKNGKTQKIMSTRSILFDKGQVAALIAAVEAEKGAVPA